MKEIGLILYPIIGGIIGWLVGVILGKDIPGGFIHKNKARRPTDKFVEYLALFFVLYDFFICYSE